MDKQEERLKRSHVFLLKHPKVAQLGGIILMGTSSVEDDVPTAYTDGLNKRYGRKFMGKITDAQVNGLVMHENAHVFFRHVTHHKKLFRENARLANIAADFVVNDMIVQLNDPNIQLPPGALYNEEFKNWSVVKVYDYLKKKCKDKDKGKKEGDKGGNPEPGDGDGVPTNGSHPPETEDKQTDIDKLCENINDYDSMDEHDHEAGDKLDPKKVGEDIDKALREGGLLAGILGTSRDRRIDELLQPRVDWRNVLSQFILSCTTGKTEYTYRKYNMRQLANDMYLPSTNTDTVKEITVCIDTSGSIGSEELNEFATELVSICEMVTPERVRVVWWDTKVHGEQVFNGNYAGLKTMLKPVGGGGTRVSAVSEYLIKKSIQSECVIVFTDGYLEDNIKWTHNAPLLWLINGNSAFQPPVGSKVVMDPAYA